MAEEIRSETDVHYEDDCRKNANHVQTIHRRKVATTTTWYSDGTSRVTGVERSDWFDTGNKC